VLAYENKAARRIVADVAPDAMRLRWSRESRFPDETAARMRELADEALARGVTMTADGMPVRWQNDDGTWNDRVFDWVLQPLLSDGGYVEGILWIGRVRPKADDNERVRATSR
jgi:hypothetical protein